MLKHTLNDEQDSPDIVHGSCDNGHGSLDDNHGSFDDGHDVSFNHLNPHFYPIRHQGPFKTSSDTNSYRKYTV